MNKVPNRNSEQNTVLRIRDVLSRILIFIHPGSNNSTKRGGGKNFLCPTIFCCHKYHKILNNFIFEQVKKFLAKKIRIKVLFTQNLSLRYQIYGFGSVIGDPGSGKNIFRIPDQE